MATHPHKGPDATGWRARLVAWVRSRPLGWRLSVPVACACAGLLATTSMINARGTDLRGGRHTDLIGIVSEQRTSVQQLRRSVRAMQDQVDALAAQVSGSKLDQLRDQLEHLEPSAGLSELDGPGLVVALDDAPRRQPNTDDIDPNLLVVHQQDIQAVVNALWAGGAEGITLQGQRIIATTGIKCVGNTVILQGVPYSPPYRIAAVGSSSAMYDSLLDSREVETYLQYTEPPYNLGWSLRDASDLRLAPYLGTLGLDFAQPSDAS
jgi:uncharacterized protein YlxW (UPF0749 family)